MFKKRQKRVLEFESSVLMNAIDKIDDILGTEDVLPDTVVSHLFQVRQVLRWHLKHSTGPQKSLGTP